MRSNRLTGLVLRKNIAAAVLGMAVSTMNTILDAFLMGNLLGPEALSAINLSLPLNYALVTVQCILASGASLLVSKKLGERDRREADKIFTVSVLSIFAASLALMPLSGQLAKPVAGFLCSRAELTDLVREYCRVEILCSMPILFQIALSSFAQRAGNPGIVLKANTASLVINILMDVIYVRVLGLGIGGAALATGTGALAACAATAAALGKKKALGFCLPGEEAGKILAANMSAGLPGALQNVAVSILTFVLNFFIQGTEGTDGVFVLSVGMNFLSFALFFAMGVQSMFTSIGSMLHGEGDDTGLGMLLQSAVRIVLPVTCVLVGVQLLIPEYLAGLFGARTTGQLIMASRGLRIMSLYSVPLAVLLLMVADYQVLGYYALASACSAGILATLPLFLWLIGSTLPAGCIWLAMPVSGAVTVLLVMAGSEICRRGAREKLQAFTLLPTDSGDKEIFETTVELRRGDWRTFRECTEGMVPFFERLSLGREQSIRYRLCVEEMLSAILSCSGKEREAADLRISATKEEIRVLIRDNLPPCNPLAGEEMEYSRKILNAFCPKLDYRYAFLQNVHTLEWKRKI